MKIKFIPGKSDDVGYIRQLIDMYGDSKWTVDTCGMGGYWRAIQCHGDKKSCIEHVLEDSFIAEEEEWDYTSRYEKALKAANEAMKELAAARDALLNSSSTMKSINSFMKDCGFDGEVKVKTSL